MNYRPVVVHVSELIAQALIVLGFETERVVDDIEMSRIDGALRGVLRNQIEIEPLGSCHHRVDDRTARRIGESVVDFGKEASVYSLFNHNKRHQWSF